MSVHLIVISIIDLLSPIIHQASLFAVLRDHKVTFLAYILKTFAYLLLS